MLTRPRLDDYRVIGYHTGTVVIGVGMLTVIPLLTALARFEWVVAVDFVLAGALIIAAGYGFRLFSWRPHLPGLGWMHGLVVAAFAWLVSVLLGALPYYLSGYYGSYLDGVFDVMSGFTTTGLTLVRDLDHVPDGLNMWRHLLTYVGGQGMIVLALTFMFSGTTAGLFRMYVGEAKDERLEPNVTHTAKAIWVISLVWLGVGTVTLWIAGLAIGMQPLRAFFHGLWVFMAGWSTGGFAPQSQNILHYHSTVYELLTYIIFVAGSLNFALHYAVWSGRREEIRKNIESVTFFLSLSALGIVAALGLAQSGVYPNAVALLRKGFYIISSGHTGTGFQTVYGRRLLLEWNHTALLVATVVMLLGGSACSTAGGFKAMRIGITFKGLLQDIKKLILPESAVVVQKYHHGKDVVLLDPAVRSAMLIILLYIITWVVGTLGGVLSGYDLVGSMFESASATGNVGLTAGITSPGMPDALKVLYVLIMWVGRMEFMSIMGLVAFIYMAVRRR